MSQELEYHELAGIFPMMEGAAYDALKEDIRVNFQKEPIWTYLGKIIDGRNRYRACRELGYEPRLREWDGKGDLLTFIVSLNLHRRHLSDSQRAMIAARISNLEHGQKKADRPIGTSSPVTQKEAAELLNVSHRNVKRAAEVTRTGVPELIEAVHANKVSVSAAAAVAELPDEEQSELVSAGPLAIVKRAKQVKTERVAVRPARTNPKPKPTPPVPHEDEAAAADLAIKWIKNKGDLRFIVRNMTEDQMKSLAIIMNKRDRQTTIEELRDLMSAIKRWIAILEKPNA